ncbi:hypothetical protein [Paenibacillus tyrfis]|uniref:hypothetical protein n=1 Tax=Paenibacillus tyrfis TaxID=1501230 RepID=UPI00209E3D62|nr:hypothetical protein [Paenibacillus tyrfis]MCP1308061.1 hypothetical protein [Paenibacillus tyrfis]
MNKRKTLFQRISLFLSILIGISGVSNVLQVYAEESDTTVYLANDFESYTQTGAPPSGFELTGIADVKKTSGALRDGNTVPNGTSVALRINESVPDQPDVGLAKRFGTDNLTGKIIIDFDIKSLDTNGSKFIEIKDSNNKGITLGTLGADGLLKVGDQSVVMTPTQWHRLSFMIDYQQSAQTTSVYVDGVKKWIPSSYLTAAVR